MPAKKTPNHSRGYLVIQEALKDPNTVQLFEQNDTYYVTTESVELYMGAVDVGLSEAISDIAKANDIDENKIQIVSM